MEKGVKGCGKMPPPAYEPLAGVAWFLSGEAEGAVI